MGGEGTPRTAPLLQLHSSPLLGSLAHRRGDPTPRHPQSGRGPCARLRGHTPQTNSGKGAMLAFLGRGRPGPPGTGEERKAPGQQGGHRRSERLEVHLSTARTTHERRRVAESHGAPTGSRGQPAPGPARHAPSPALGGRTRRAAQVLPGRPAAAPARRALRLVGRRGGGPRNPGRPRPPG